MIVEQIMWSVEQRVEQSRSLVQFGFVQSGVGRNLYLQNMASVAVHDCAVRSHLL